MTIVSYFNNLSLSCKVQIDTRIQGLGNLVKTFEVITLWRKNIPKNFNKIPVGHG